MTSLTDAVNAADLPAPLNGEHIESYARRVALAGAHIGAANALANSIPAIVAAEVASKEEVTDDPADS